MTVGAGRRYSEISLPQILYFDGSGLLRRYPFRRVTTATLQRGMLALEFVTGLGVIESFDIELHDRKILAVMLRMAADALLTRSRLWVVPGMQSSSRRDS